jgi:hypothetical protein
MAKKKARKNERVVIEEFTWEQFPVQGEWLPGTSAAQIEDRWRLVGKGALNLWEVEIRVTDFGESDDEYRSGWRVLAGAPEKERYETRDEAMIGAVKIIHREVRARLEGAHARFKTYHDMAKEVGAI